MRSNGGVIGPLNTGQKGIWRVDDQQRGGVILPYTEAMAAADPRNKTFVCQMKGSASEVGVGLFAGADLVLAAVNNPPAAVDGHRAFGPTHKLQCTAAFSSTLFAGEEWTFAQEFVSATPSFNYAFSYFDTSPRTHMFNPYFSWEWGQVELGAYSEGGNPVPPGALGNTASKTWLVAWRKNGIHHVGFVTQNDLPTGWESFPPNQRAAARVPVIGAKTWLGNYIIGASNSAGVSRGVGTIVCSTIGLSAEPR